MPQQLDEAEAKITLRFEEIEVTQSCIPKPSGLLPLA
jgi:hypothetical protein